jgi:hypothetical protein
VATVTFEKPQNGRIGVIRELLEIDLGPEHVSALRTIVDPVLIFEMPTIAWSPHGHDEAVRNLLPLIDVMLLDSDDLRDPGHAFTRAQELFDHVYVVDLAWLRTTPWRERLVSEREVRHQEGSSASSLLLAAWMATRLQWQSSPLHFAGRGVLTGSARRDGDDEIELCLRTVGQEVAGLAGVTVCCSRGTSLSLQRGVGGLDAQERNLEGETREWKILGASRGEGGILGEGVRQALLRDPTYGPALAAAKDLYPA